MNRLRSFITCLWFGIALFAPLEIASCRLVTRGFAQNTQPASATQDTRDTQDIQDTQATQATQETQAAISRTDTTRQAVQYRLTLEDHQLLDDIQWGCFQYFWQEVGNPVPLVRDRKLAPVSSIAAVGFQLSSLPIGVERGWISHEEGEQRALQILKGLIDQKGNKYRGVYLHFLDLKSGGLSQEGYETVASTVDHALLMAGALPAAVYFGGEVERWVDRLIDQTNWQAYAVAEGELLSMGWRPDDPSVLPGPGQFLSYYWKDSGDEERLLYFLAVGSPNPNHALPARRYYQTQRPIRRWEDGEAFVVTYPGALFTYFFSHCWIDYKVYAEDAPTLFGSQQPPVDWFENSRRAIATHRARCIDMAPQFATLSKNRWGLSACDGPNGYIVPNVRPNLAEKDDWHQGTVAPYAAGASIMFLPEDSLAALREFRHLRNEQGESLVWRDPKLGGYGLVDAFNLDLHWASPDYIGIDQGPLLLAIENVRSGLIWKLTMQHSLSQRAIQRLKWNPIEVKGVE